MKKNVFALLLLFAMVLSLAACGGTTTTTPAPDTTAATATAESTSAPAAPAESTPTAAAPAETTPASSEEKTVYVIVKVLGNQYWSVLQAGAEKAGEDFGCNVVIVGTAAESDIEGQVRYLQDAISAQADAIIIAPLDSQAMNNPIEEAHGQGIPIILVDTKVVGDGYDAALLTDNVEAGRMAASEMLEKLRTKGVDENQEGVIAIQAGSAGSQAINDRLKGFNEYWDANAPAAWKVLNDDIKINDGDISKAVGFCQDFLTTYPDLIAVFGPNNGSTVGFVTGLTEANRTDITMVGFDFSTEMEGMIRSGDFNVATMVQRQYFMGYDGVRIALDLASGGTVSEKTIDTGVMVVDGANIDSPEVQGVIHPGT